MRQVVLKNTTKMGDSGLLHRLSSRLLCFSWNVCLLLLASFDAYGVHNFPILLSCFVLFFSYCHRCFLEALNREFLRTSLSPWLMTILLQHRNLKVLNCQCHNGKPSTANIFLQIHCSVSRLKNYLTYRTATQRPKRILEMSKSLGVKRFLDIDSKKSSVSSVLGDVGVPFRTSLLTSRLNVAVLSALRAPGSQSFWRVEGPRSLDKQNILGMFWTFQTFFETFLGLSWPWPEGLGLLVETFDFGPQDSLFQAE